MKLFNGFEAVKFIQENLIFITHDGYLYYIYNPKYNHWRKYSNAGNVHLTTVNYPSVTKEELVDAMNGVFPKKETDFMRLCDPSQLWIRDMIDLLREDYANYLSDNVLYCDIHTLLLESNMCHKSFLEIKKLLEKAISVGQDKNQISKQIKDLSFKILGRDIYKKEIGIVDGHNSSSYFWIMPVRVVDFSDTSFVNNVAEMRSVEISIEEDDVYKYLTPFLYKYFDNELEANKKRIEYRWTDNNGNEQISCVSDFKWNLTYNFFTFDSIKNILKDINDTVDALSSGRENEYTKKLRKNDSDMLELIIDF
jgi:hypothetical protein